MKNYTTRVFATAALITTGFAVFATSTPTQAQGIKNQRPSASITSPNKQMSVGKNFAVNVDASDPEDKLLYVEAYLIGPNGYQSLGVDTSAPYSFDINNAAIGKYRIYARAVDEGFRTSRYDSVKVTVQYANVVEAAVATPDLSTLVAAVQAAGLVDPLIAGNLTVFAPVNSAFDALPAGTVTTLLKPENKAALSKVLTYHVVAGKINLAHMEDGDQLTTLQGQKLTIQKSGHTISLKTTTGQVIMVGTNLSSVIKNANAYLIDQVLLPQ
jgi:uncharacterized surface protein with fasciclin (FAS1) repeats